MTHHNDSTITKGHIIMSQWLHNDTVTIHNHTLQSHSDSTITVTIHNHTLQSHSDSTITATHHNIKMTPQSQWHVTLSQWLHNHSDTSQYHSDSTITDTLLPFPRFDNSFVHTLRCVAAGAENVHATVYSYIWLSGASSRRVSRFGLAVRR